MLHVIIKPYLLVVNVILLNDIQHYIQWGLVLLVFAHHPIESLRGAPGRPRKVPESVVDHGYTWVLAGSSWWFQRFFCFSPRFGMIGWLTKYFHRGWNHQGQLSEYDLEFSAPKLGRFPPQYSVFLPLRHRSEPYAKERWIYMDLGSQLLG